MADDEIPLVDLQAQHAALRPEIDAAIGRVLERADFILGSEVGAFERDFAAYLGCREVVGVGSGFDALRLILLGLGIGPGEDVILPANTFFATAASVAATGARPILVDVLEDTCNLDPSRLERALTPKTRAVIGVHLYGRCCAAEPIADFCRAKGLPFLEDAAQAHGAWVGGRAAGTLGLAGAFSFYPGKNLGACGDGGAVSTDDRGLAAAIRKWRNHGQERKHVHEVPGHNSRLDTVQAAIRRVKLPKLDGWNRARKAHAKAYRQALVRSPGAIPVDRDEGADHVHHLFAVRVPARDRVQAALNDAGIGAQVHYPTPIHLQPAFRSLGYGEGAFPVSERLSREVLSLPLYPELTPEQRGRVVTALAEVVK